MPRRRVRDAGGAGGGGAAGQAARAHRPWCRRSRRWRRGWWRRGRCARCRSSGASRTYAGQDAPREGACVRSDRERGRGRGRGRAAAGVGAPGGVDAVQPQLCGGAMREGRRHGLKVRDGAQLLGPVAVLSRHATPARVSRATSRGASSPERPRRDGGSRGAQAGREESSLSSWTWRAADFGGGAHQVSEGGGDGGVDEGLVGQLRVRGERRVLGRRQPQPDLARQRGRGGRTEVTDVHPPPSGGGRAGGPTWLSSWVHM